MNPGLKLFSDIRQEYIDTLQNGLIGISVHGGCVVDFDDISRLDDNGWTNRVSQITNISSEKLLAAHKNRVKPVRVSESSTLRDLEAESIYARARSLLPDRLRN